MNIIYFSVIIVLQYKNTLLLRNKFPRKSRTLIAKYHKTDTFGFWFSIFINIFMLHNVVLYKYFLPFLPQHGIFARHYTPSIFCKVYVCNVKFWNTFMYRNIWNLLIICFYLQKCKNACKVKESFTNNLEIYVCHTEKWNLICPLDISRSLCQIYCRQCTFIFHIFACNNSIYMYDI